MKIYRFLLPIFLYLFGSILFFSSSNVNAQQANQRWVCLIPTACDRGATPCDKTVQNARRAQALGTFETPLVIDPKAPPMADAQTYIVGCTRKSSGRGQPAQPGQICSTGLAQSDSTVFGQDNTLKANVGSLVDGSNPTQSDQNGDLGSLTWAFPTRDVTFRFYAVNLFQATPTGVPITTAPNNSTPSAIGALQQGTFVFAGGLSQETLPTEEQDQDCLSIRWDPYGRVFDSQSLEPITNATVTLLQKRSDGNFSAVGSGDVVGGNITNPQSTLEDGAFSFVVPDGTYKLAVNLADFVFPVNDITMVHNNYPKIYSDIYPVITGDEIVQQGAMQHRDIPLSTAGSPTNSIPVMMSSDTQLKPNSQILVVNGRVSHPLANLTAYSVKSATRYRQVGSTQADKLGNFSLEIDQSNFESTESFGEIDIAKVDLTLLAKKESIFKKFSALIDRFIKKVNAQSKAVSTVQIEPILGYLEGYAYDSLGKAMPNAVIGVYLSTSSKPYYQTTADNRGYFKITSEFLPKIAYGLQYASPTGDIVKATTSQFISQNQQYLENNKIDLNVYKNKENKIITTDISKTQTGAPIGIKKKSSQNTGVPIILIALLILLLMGLIVASIVLLKRVKGKPPITTDIQ